MRADFYDEYIDIEDEHWWFRGRREILPSLLRGHLNPPIDILDIGSGGGAVAETLTEFGRVTACDIDARCEASVLRRGGMTFTYGRAESVPLPDASFDLVTAFDVVEHVEDDHRAVEEIRRLLRPQGLVAIAVPAYGWMWGRQDEINGHFRRYDRRMLRALLTASGFRLVRLTSFNTFLFPPAAAVRLWRRALGERASAGTDLQSDFTMTRPGRINDALAWMFAAERLPLRYVDLPFGTSLLAIARR